VAKTHTHKGLSVKNSLENNLIYKSNDLIEASYGLTVNEQRLVLACISQIKSDTNILETTAYTLTLDQSRDLFYNEKDKYNAYQDMRDACDRLYKREVRLKSEDGNSELWTRWVQAIEFDNKKQEAKLYFSIKILPYLSQLHGNFTKYRLKNMVQLTSTHAIRIYELIVMWAGQSKNYKELQIDEFKELLGLTGKYKQVGQLKEKVISVAVEQITTHTDFNLSIEIKRIGMSNHYVQLSFGQKPTATAAEAQRKQARIASKPKPTKSSNPLKGIKDLEAFYQKHKLGVESKEETFNRLRKEAADGTFSLSLTD
jgi:plasmid replication initiation protein